MVRHATMFTVVPFSYHTCITSGLDCQRSSMPVSADVRNVVKMSWPNLMPAVARSTMPNPDTVSAPKKVAEEVPWSSRFNGQLAEEASASFLPGM